MPTTVKICGIKSKEEIEIINRFPISYMGLIFAPSKRQVTREKAIELRAQVRNDIQVVGVFVNDDVEKVNELIEACNLQVVQLHGDESVDYCSKIRAKVWKSIPVKDEESLKKIEMYAPFVDGILLDTYSESEKGGTGKFFNWELVKGLTARYPIILAGGLTPEIVVDAIEMVRPKCVDMNSGLETNLIKDETKIAKLFARLTEAGLNE